MDMLLGILAVWLVTGVIFWALTFWLLSGLKQRFPKGNLYWWFLEMLPVAFAIAPAGAVAGNVGMVYPAAWNILIYFSKAQPSPQEMRALDQGLISLLITWVSLWLVRWFFSWFIRRQ